MAEKRRSDKLLNPTNILLGVLITVITSFFGYIIGDIKDLKSEVNLMKTCVQEQVANTKELLIAHIETWHKDKKNESN